MDDFNCDFLKFDRFKWSTLCLHERMSFSYITNPTRQSNASATLLNHICTKTVEIANILCTQATEKPSVISRNMYMATSTSSQGRCNIFINTATKMINLIKKISLTNSYFSPNLQVMITEIQTNRKTLHLADA